MFVHFQAASRPNDLIFQDRPEQIMYWKMPTTTRLPTAKGDTGKGHLYHLAFQKSAVQDTIKTG